MYTRFIGGTGKGSTLLFAPDIRIQILRNSMVNDWIQGPNSLAVILASLRAQIIKKNCLKKPYEKKRWFVKWNSLLLLINDFVHFILWSTKCLITKSRWKFNWREEKYTPVRFWYPDTNFKKFDVWRLISRLRLARCNTGIIGGTGKESTLLFAPDIQIQILRNSMFNDLFQGSTIGLL